MHREPITLPLSVDEEIDGRCQRPPEFPGCGSSLVERLVWEQAEALRKAGLEASRERDSTFARFSRYPYVEYPNRSYGRPLCLGRTNN